MFKEISLNCEKLEMVLSSCASMGLLCIRKVELWELKQVTLNIERQQVAHAGKDMQHYEKRLLYNCETKTRILSLGFVVITLHPTHLSVCVFYFLFLLYALYFVLKMAFSFLPQIHFCSISSRKYVKHSWANFSLVSYVMHVLRILRSGFLKSWAGS